MSFFKRKDKNLIPPPESSQPAYAPRSVTPGAPPSYRSSSATYNASRDGDAYNSPSAPPAPAPTSFNDRYARKNAVGDVYSRGQGNVDKDRGELFSGYNAEKAGSGRFFGDVSRGAGASAGREPPPAEEGEEDIEGIKQDIRFTKQESLSSTRNALRLAREAEETARGTVDRLANQSEKLSNTERHLDVSKGYALRAEDKTDELKQLNRSIFRPVITFNKDSKRSAEEAKLQQRYEEEREEREKAMVDVRNTQNRLGRAQAYGRTGDEGIMPGGSGRFKSASQLDARKEQRKRYQFDATASDDEVEDELDDNLDEISNITKSLKALGTAMGQELDTQNNRIERITDKAGGLDERIYKNTQRLNKIK